MILSGLGLGVAFAAGPRLAHARWAVASTFGVMPAGGAVDRTAMLQQAIDAAAKSGEPLFLPPGIYSTRRLELKSGTHLTGMPGKSILRYRDGGGLIGVEQAEDIRLDGIVLDGGGRDMGIDGALLTATLVERLQLSNCSFLRSGSGAILVARSENVIIAGNMVDEAATGIALIDGTKAGKPALIKGNLVRNLFFRKIAPSHGNGITVEADAIVTGNAVENAPGFGILVGRDVRDVGIAKNDIRNAHIGIGIPTAIAETAAIAGNRISGVRDGAIRAMNGPTPIGPDLA
jgi:polygalacturonase